MNYFLDFVLNWHSIQFYSIIFLVAEHMVIYLGKKYDAPQS